MSFISNNGKYQAHKHVASKKKKKILPLILIIIALILAICVGGGIWYYNHLLNMISRPGDPVTNMPTETYSVLEGNDPETYASKETGPMETSPEDTWPKIASDENISNFMLVGQAAREGETHLISDTMILVSINRETKTLTLTSLMRDMRLVWPKYVDTLGKEHSGNNRINMAYNMGYSWTKNKQDGMDMLESIVQHNFGVPVDRTIEIDFEVFREIVDLMGGVTVNVDEAELAYLQENYKWMEEVTVGDYNMSGYKALCYARMRKVGHGDYERTERQREVITALLNKLKGMNILQIHKLFTTILPMITTDMSNKEITNYAFEFIPMLKDLKIQSQRIPFDGNETSVTHTYEDGTVDYMIAPADLKATARQLQESIGMPVAD